MVDKDLPNNINRNISKTLKKTLKLNLSTCLRSSLTCHMPNHLKFSTVLVTHVCSLMYVKSFRKPFFSFMFHGPGVDIVLCSLGYRPW